MKKKGRLKKIIIIVLILLAAGGGIGFGIWYWMNHRSSAVEVQSVASVNRADWFYFGDEEGSYGTITSDVSQSVHVPDDMVVDEVYVDEGDQVKIGDKLLSYDTTLLELDKELQELNVQEIELELKAAESDLAKLKNTTPVARSSSDDEEDDSSSLDDIGSSWDDEDEEDDEARLYNNDREILAAAEAQGGQEETAQVQTEDPSAAEEQTVSEAGTDAVQTGDAGQDAEQTIENDDTVIENLTPGDLDQAGQTEQTQEYGSIEDAETGASGDVEKPKLNQSLNGYLTNVRIKEKDGDGNEILLADAAEQPEGEAAVAAQISADQVKLIPHFKEDEEHRFGRLDTYILYIRGIKLEADIAGKAYGKAVLDGEDYPEIGGYTLVQYTKTDADDVVKLTLAFHDGLDEQQAEGMLSDMYLEIPLSTKELVSDSLILRTSKDEKEDIAMDLVLPETEEETGITQTETDSAEIDSAEIDSAEIGGAETEETGSAETEPDGGEEEILSEAETESGTASSEMESDETTQSETNGSVLSEFRATVQWNHGTNEREKWPTSLTMLFYEHAEAPDPVYTRELVPGEPVYNENGGSGEQEADSEPETENESMESTAGTSETEEMTEAPLSEVVDDPTDPYAGTQLWSNLPVNWSELGAPKNPNEYYMTVSVPNYIPTIWWDDAAKCYTIIMNYLEPEESPLIKFNPLSELDYASGADGKYYKGSGTKDDPYVFFCTDGAVIRSSFVNWVLGFDELGTERMSDGYYVVLEIRESDSITGAFIRSIGLDGTIRVDHGYGPGTYWIFTSNTGIVRYEEDIPDDGGDDGYDDPGWIDSGDGYTAEELAAAIDAKEKEIRQLKVDEKKAKLDLKKYTKELEECNVVSAVNGYVKSIGDDEDSDAYMVVSSEEGLYLKSTVSEMDLDSVEKGQVVSCTSYDTGMQFTATITQIDYFPTATQSDFWYSSGNSNSSSYPIMAVVEDADGLSEYESVSVKFPTASESTANKIYIEKMYIRSENGQSYVYIADENGLLKKQYIRTGANNYGTVEVKDGLTEDDRIAFPYGKTVKEGAKTVEVDNDEYY